jgi:molybdenum cofactor synthesis domain-containing protein
MMDKLFLYIRGGIYLKKVRVEDAVGMVLAHDLTKIIPGEFKGAAFKKGYIIKEQDIDMLKSMGKNHIFIMELNEDNIHEEEAAIRIAKAAAGEGIYLTDPSEGKVNLKASSRGLLKINLDALEEINNIDLIILATLHNNTLVEKDKLVAGTKIIPLTVEKNKIEQVEKICDEMGKVISIKPIKSMKVGIVVTGTEVYEGRIKDKFGPVLLGKVENYGCELVGMKFAPDNIEMIQDAVNSLIEEGAEMIMTSGGMSVDADDVTPTAIKGIASKVITYGSPVLPGAMFMLAYKDSVAILGVPACGMYHKITVLDLVLQRVVAGEELTRKDMASLAHGGLCQGCEVCHYPICPFGK